jgi:hypothetical protein
VIGTLPCDVQQAPGCRATEHLPVSNSTSPTERRDLAAKSLLFQWSGWPLSRLVLLAAMLLLLVVWGSVIVLLWNNWNETVEAEVRQNTNLASVLQECHGHAGTPASPCAPSSGWRSLNWIKETAGSDLYIKVYS